MVALGKLVSFADQFQIVIGTILAHVAQQLAEFGDREHVGRDLFAQGGHFVSTACRIRPVWRRRLPRNSVRWAGSLFLIITSVAAAGSAQPAALELTFGTARTPTAAQREIAAPSLAVLCEPQCSLW